MVQKLSAACMGIAMFFSVLEAQSVEEWSESGKVYIPHVVVGGCKEKSAKVKCGWETEVIIQNRSASTLKLRMISHGMQGGASISICKFSNGTSVRADEDRAVVFPDTPPSGSLSCEVGFPPEVQNKGGWITIETLTRKGAQFEAPRKGEIEAIMIYRYREGSGTVQQGFAKAATLSSGFSFAFASHYSDRIGSLADVALALANPNPKVARLTFSIRGKEWYERGNFTVLVPPMGQVAGMLRDLVKLPWYNIEGLIQIASDVPVAAIAFQAKGELNVPDKTVLYPLALRPVD